MGKAWSARSGRRSSFWKNGRTCFDGWRAGCQLRRGDQSTTLWRRRGDVSSIRRRFGKSWRRFNYFLDLFMSLQQKSDTELRRKLETLSRRGVARKASPRKRKTDKGGDLRRLVHDLQVHQIELEVQNRELQEAQAELEGSRNRYAELYDFAPV